jgi:uncharacterized phage protein (TIGR02218 family)
MTYLNRPVFDFALDWSEQLSRQAAFDLRSRQIGFGPMSAEPQQLHVADAYQFGVDLPDPCSINAMERFWQGVYGRLRGFWFVAPERTMTIVAGVSATQFDIAAQGLADDWEQNPSIHLAVLDASAPDSQPQLRAISAVATISPEVERVTLTAALTAAPTPEWDVYRLLYGRFAEDDLTLQFYEPGKARSTIKVLELPIEYTSVELGNRPAFLYHFWRDLDGSRVDWYFTSFDEALTAGTVLVQHVHTPAPISHRDLTRGITGEREQLEIQTWRFTGNPLLLWQPFSPQYDLFVEVSEVQLGESTISAAKLLFSGLVETVSPKGQVLAVTCTTRLDRLGTTLPTFKIQRPCNHVLYGAACKADRAAFSVSVTVQGIDAFGLSMLLSASGLGARPSGWFAYGDAESIDANGLREVRAIVGSTTGGGDEHSIQLSSPFSRKPEVGDTLVIAAGCDLAHTTCDGKFDNYENFGGHPFIGANLTLKTVPLNQDGGGKGGGK